MSVPKPITIKPCLNGFICTVGCQTVVFNDIDYLLKELGDYLRNPDYIEQGYRSQAIHRAMLLDQPIAANQCCAQESCTDSPLLRDGMPSPPTLGLR